MCNCNPGEQKIENDMLTPTKDKFLDFDQFIDVMKDKIIDEKANMDDGDIVFEAQSSNVSCLFWPY